MDKSDPLNSSRSYRKKVFKKPYFHQQGGIQTNPSGQGSPRSSTSILVSFLGSWQFWLACLSALAYMLGYYRALLLFSALGIFITPTEVYDLLSMFTWGITTLIAALPMGILATVLGYLLSKVIPLSKPWHALTLGLALYLVFRVFYTLLPWLADYNPIGFMFVPSRVIYFDWYTFFPLYWSWNAIVLSAVVLFSFLYFKFRKGYVILAYLLGFLIWVILLTSTQYYDFKSITGGGAINSVSQYPGMNGLIITNSLVSFVGKPFPEFGETAYGMWGLLLSRHSGNYYFIPWIVANTYQIENVEPEIAYQYGEVVIIPEKNVISFLKRFSDTIDFIGVSPPADQ